jgi:ethanolamine permease
MQMISFIVLRQNYAHIDRPYVSPLGLWGAAIAGIIALVTLFFLFMNEAYVIGIYGCAVWFMLGLLYFGLYARHAMILSPEEEFAVALGKQQVGR